MEDKNFRAKIARFRDTRIKVIYWKCYGLKHNTIAEILDRDVKTVQYHVSKTYEILGYEGDKEEMFEQLKKEVWPGIQDVIETPEDLDRWDFIRNKIKAQLREEEPEEPVPAPPVFIPQPEPEEPEEPIPAPPIFIPHPEPEPEPEPTPTPPPEPEPEPGGPITIDPVPPRPRPRPRPEPTPRPPSYIGTCLFIAGTIFLCFAFYQIYNTYSLELNKFLSGQSAPFAPSTPSTPLSEAARFNFRNGVDPAWRLEGDQIDITDNGIVSRGTTLLYLGNESWRNYNVNFQLYNVEGGYEGSIGVRNSTNCVIRHVYQNDINVVSGNTSILIPTKGEVKMDVPINAYNTIRVIGNEININVLNRKSIHVIPDQYATLCSTGGVVFELKGDTALRYVSIGPVSD